jgi:hypothetical protein
VPGAQAEQPQPLEAAPQNAAVPQQATLPEARAGRPGGLRVSRPRERPLQGVARAQALWLQEPKAAREAASVLPPEAEARPQVGQPREALMAAPEAQSLPSAG